MIQIISTNTIDDLSDAGIAAALNAAVSQLPGTNLPHSASIALWTRVDIPAMAITTNSIVSLQCTGEDITVNEETGAISATLLVGHMDYARSVSPGPLTTAAINAQESRVNAS